MKKVSRKQFELAACWHDSTNKVDLGDGAVLVAYHEKGRLIASEVKYTSGARVYKAR